MSLGEHSRRCLRITDSAPTKLGVAAQSSVRAASQSASTARTRAGGGILTEFPLHHLPKNDIVLTIEKELSSAAPTRR